MKIEREELKNLRDALVNLMDFIDVVEQGELPEFYRYFDTMKNNIEIFICIGCDDTEDIVPVLERDWKNVFRHCSGSGEGLESFTYYVYRCSGL